VEQALDARAGKACAVSAARACSRHRPLCQRTCLQREQQQEGLYAVVAAVHEVAHEQVVGLRAVAADLEQLHEVVELPMDVAACASL